MSLNLRLVCTRKMPLNFCNRKMPLNLFKNTHTISFRWKLSKFYFKNTIELLKRFINFIDLKKVKNILVYPKFTLIFSPNKIKIKNLS